MSEITQEDRHERLRKGYRPWRNIARKFFRYRAATIALAGLVVIVMFAFAGPSLWRFSYLVATSNLSTPPSWEHPFGTDALGYDMMANVMRGAQRSLQIALVVTCISTVLGFVWGAVAGYFGGWIDTLMMRFVDLLMLFPVVAVAAFLARRDAGTSNGWLFVSLVLSALFWMMLARVVRSEVLSLRRKEYIQAARIAGAGTTRILLKHLLPNCAGAIIVTTTVLVANAMLVESALSYLGFGVQSPDTSLGLLINQAQTAISTRPWMFYFPGAMLVLTVLCVAFIGDGLRAALDPKESRV